jgi:outer membrane protein TolC
MIALQADIYGEIESAERAEHIARESTDVAERRLAAVRRQQQQVDLELRLGASGTLDTIAAEILVTRAELEVTQTRAQLQASRNDLENVLRTPLSGPELALAKSLSATTTGSGS